MKQYFIFLLVGWLVLSCNSKKTAAPAQEEANEFFPVTEFLKGQLTDIKTNGVTPLKINIQNKQPDSNWIKVPEMETAFAEFTSPNIDSTGLGQFFNTKKFFDQTLNLITLTYDAKETLPASVPWKHWDVYIDPEKNMVTRIYLIKQIDEHTIRQLTWITGKYCRAVSIREDSTGHSSISDETIIKWRY
jgi:hypothetical protein